MIGFVVRQVKLQQVETLVDGVDQTVAPCQQMEDANAATIDSGHLRRNVIVDIAGGELRFKGHRVVFLVEPAINSALALAEPKFENGIHLKSFCGSGDWWTDNEPNTANHRRISSFLKKPREGARNPRLFKA